jgi:hypothetical protein
MSNDPVTPGQSPIPVIVLEAAHSFPWMEFWLITVPTVLLALVTLHADHELFVMLRLVLSRVLPPYRRPEPTSQPDGLLPKAPVPGEDF